VLYNDILFVNEQKRHFLTETALVATLNVANQIDNER